MGTKARVIRTQASTSKSDGVASLHSGVACRLARTKDSDPVSAELRNAKCLACNGSGVSPNWRDRECKECKGMGRVIRVAMLVETRPMPQTRSWPRGWGGR